MIFFRLIEKNQLFENPKKFASFFVSLQAEYIIHFNIIN